MGGGSKMADYTMQPIHRQAENFSLIYYRVLTLFSVLFVDFMFVKAFKTLSNARLLFAVLNFSYEYTWELLMCSPFICKFALCTFIKI